MFCSCVLLFNNTDCFYICFLYVDFLYAKNNKFSFNVSTTWCSLQARKVPEVDPRLAATKEIIARVQKRNNWIPQAQTETPKEGDQEQEHGEDMHFSADGDESSMQDPVALDGDVEDQTTEHVAADGENEQQSREPVAATTYT